MSSVTTPSLSREIVSSLRVPTVEIGEGLPWSNWELPVYVQCPLSELSFQPFDDLRCRVLAQNYILGLAIPDFYDDLGKLVGFPSNFVQKLRPDLRSQIINECILNTPKNPYCSLSFTREENGDDRRVLSLTPGWRELLGHSEVAQHAYDSLSQVANVSECESAYVNKNKMTLRILTEKTGIVSPSVGDVLSYGVQVEYSPGDNIAASLYARRLVCTNGMSSVQEAMSWKSRDSGSADSQLDWVSSAVIKAFNSSDSITVKSQEMVEARISGNNEEVLRDRIRQMRIPNRYADGIYEAFLQEPGDSEWHMLNAITRFASHSNDVSLNDQLRIQQGAGNWVESFDMVNARLPRPIANRVGAEIIDVE